MIIVPKELVEAMEREYALIASSFAAKDLHEHIANRAAEWALELAIAKCRNYHKESMTAEYNEGCRDCADEIRALISPSGELAGTGGDDGQG